MVEFTEAQIQGMLKQLKDYYENPTRELAVLELEDLKRKGCLLESTDGSCYGCSAMKDCGHCPMDRWDERHPEWKDDILAMKIKYLEAGGEEAYKAKAEAWKKAQEKHTSIEKVVVATGNGDLDTWQIRANDDDSILAIVYNEYLAEVIQKAVEEDIEKHESTCWQE